MQHSLVRWNHVNAPSPRARSELVRYLRSEYGEDAHYALARVEGAGEIRTIRIPNGTAGLLRRFVEALSETFASARASPGGA